MPQKEFLVRASCVGITPLLMAAMDEETIENVLIRGERPRKAKDLPLVEMAKTCLYKGPEGKLGIPAENLFACLVQTGTLFKYDGRRSISTGEASFLPSFLSIEDTFLPLTNLTNNEGGLPWKVDLRRGVLENGTAVGIVRPKFETWGFDVTLRIDLTDQPVTLDTCHALLRKAGRAKGLCSFRPGRRGPFGQFLVATWTSERVNGTEDSDEELEAIADAA